MDNIPQRVLPAYESAQATVEPSEDHQVTVEPSGDYQVTVESLEDHEMMMPKEEIQLSHPGKRFVMPLLDDFILEGPNGHHPCFVFPVALNNVAIAKEAGVSDNSMFPAQVGRHPVTTSSVIYPLVRDRTHWYVGPPTSGYSYLFTNVEYADLHTQNILVQAPCYKSWPLLEPYERPEKLLVRRYDGAAIGSNVPEYQIKPAGIFTPSDTVAPDFKSWSLTLVKHSSCKPPMQHLRNLSSTPPFSSDPWK